MHRLRMRKFQRDSITQVTPEGMTMPLEIVYQSLDNLHGLYLNIQDWYFLRLSYSWWKPVVNDTFINYIGEM